MEVIGGNCLLQLFTIVIVGITTLVLLLKYWFSYWSKRGVETVSPILFFGNVLNIILRKESLAVSTKQFYTELKRRGKKFGGYYFLLRPIFLPVDLDLIKKMSINDFNHFTDHIGYVNCERDPLSSNLFQLKGERWRQLRSKLSPSFTSGKTKMMLTALLESSNNLTALVEELIQKNDAVYIKDVIDKYTSDVVVSCSFGIDDSTLKKKSKSEFQRCQHQIFGTTFIQSVNTLLLLLLPEVFKIFKIRMFDKQMTDFFMNLVQSIVKYREENDVVRKDFMHFLIQIKNNVNLDDNELDNLKNEKDKNQVSLTLDEMAAQCFVFYVAGYETSATTINFSLFELAVNPEIQDKLRAEINSIIEKNNGEITYDGIMEMKYLDKCVSETLRKYPPLPVTTRTCTKTYAIPNSNVTIQEGMNVFIPVHAIHNDPEYYPNPEKYDPERFSDENKRNRNPYAYFPFGNGPRTCIGYKFGILQVKLALMKLLKRFKFSLHPDTKPQIRFNATTFISTATPPIKLIVETITH